MQFSFLLLILRWKQASIEWSSIQGEHVDDNKRVYKWRLISFLWQLFCHPSTTPTPPYFYSFLLFIKSSWVGCKLKSVYLHLTQESYSINMWNCETDYCSLFICQVQKTTRYSTTKWNIMEQKQNKHSQSIFEYLFNDFVCHNNLTFLNSLHVGAFLLKCYIYAKCN